MVIRSSTTWGLNMNLRDLARKHWDWVFRSKDLTSKRWFSKFRWHLAGPRSRQHLDGRIMCFRVCSACESYDFLQISFPYDTQQSLVTGMTELPAFTRLTELQIDAEEWNFSWMFHLRMNIKKWGATMSRLKPFHVLGWIFSEMDPDV